MKHFGDITQIDGANIPATKTITCMDINCDVRGCKERIPIEDNKRGCVVFMPGLECPKIKENTEPKPYHTAIAERVEELTKAIINNASHDPDKVRIWAFEIGILKEAEIALNMMKDGGINGKHSL